MCVFVWDVFGIWVMGGEGWGGRRVDAMLMEGCSILVQAWNFSSWTGGWWGQQQQQQQQQQEEEKGKGKGERRRGR